MRVGLIGAGRIGARHARTLRDLEPVDEVIVADADAGAAERVAGSLGLPVARSVSDLLAMRPDGVCIAAPTPAHAEVVELVAAAGVAIFCEKPLALDIAGTRRVLDTVTAAGIPLQVGFQRRFDAGYIAARGRLHSGALGRLHTVVACTLDREPPPAAYIPTSGGLFADCSVHDIDAIVWATGRRVVEVCATGSNGSSTVLGAEHFAASGDVDTASAILTLQDGTLATIFASRYNGGGYEGRLELHGTAGTAVAGVEGIVEVAYDGFADRFGAAYTEQLRAFVELIAARPEDRESLNCCPGEAALEALYVARACERSRAERRPVPVDELRLE